VATQLRLWAPVAIYMAGIFLVSAQSDPPMPPGVSDTPMHGLAYLGLAVVVFRAVAGGLPARVTRRTAIVTLIITVGYGATDELHQLWVPGRSAEWHDLYADGIGAAIGLIGCWAWGILPQSKSQAPKPKSQC
jgi:VanZ family protein